MSGHIEGLSAAYVFEKRGPLQSALHLLKYAGMHSLGVWLGRELGGAIRSDPAFAGAGVLIPVPLHGARLRERGYNQSERICAGIALATGLSVAAGALVRTRNTRSQTELTHREREENVHGAFALRRGCGGREVRGRVVVLVDDVITTGSTLASCAAALRDAGARTVLAAAVAVAEHAI